VGSSQLGNELSVYIKSGELSASREELCRNESVDIVLSCCPDVALFTFPYLQYTSLPTATSNPTGVGDSPCLSDETTCVCCWLLSRVTFTLILRRSGGCHAMQWYQHFGGAYSFQLLP
jgi:hypothetical protein